MIAQLVQQYLYKVSAEGSTPHRKTATLHREKYALYKETATIMVYFVKKKKKREREDPKMWVLTNRPLACARERLGPIYEPRPLACARERLGPIYEPARN
jgi:hypothetical protein